MHLSSLIIILSFRAGDRQYAALLSRAAGVLAGCISKKQKHLRRAAHHHHGNRFRRAHLLFVIFGLTISLVSLLHLDVALISGLIILSIYAIRFVILRLFGQRHHPQLSSPPRAVTILLLRHPQRAVVPGFEAGILLFIIIGTSLIMTFAMVYDKQRAGKGCEEGAERAGGL